MSASHYSSIEDFRVDLSDDHRPILDEIKRLVAQHDDTNESIRRGCYHVRWPNGMRIYVSTYKQPYPILGISRGAWMVRQEPIFASLFDEVLKVVGKIHLPTLDHVQRKGIRALLDHIAGYPAGINTQ